MSKKELKRFGRAFIDVIKMFSKGICVAIAVTIPLLVIVVGLMFVFKSKIAVLISLGLLNLIGWTIFFYKMDKDN